MKDKTVITVVAIFSVVLLAFAGLMFFGGPSSQAVTGDMITTESGDVVGPWTNSIVQYKLSVKDKYTGADVPAIAKVYDVKPADWNNPRGTFDEASKYTIYNAANGYVTIDDELPGKYYVVMTANNYNTEFVEISIPDGTGRSIDVSDYNSAPDVKSTPMSEVGTTNDVDISLTLVNDTSADIDEDARAKVAANTEFRGWKVIVNDEEGFSTDTNGDGTYDEGIKSYEVCVADVCKVVFDPSKAIDEFDSNDKYTFYIEGKNIADDNKLDINVKIKAITSDSVGANDEAWGEGEGVLSYIKVYDLSGHLFTTTDVTA